MNRGRAGYRGPVSDAVDLDPGVGADPTGPRAPRRSTLAGHRRSQRAGAVDPSTISAWLTEYRRTQDRRVRNRIVEAHLHLVDHYVARYERGAASADDVRQTALVALIGAVDRFDPTAGASLRTFADRTIEGELKRYLRDRTWLVRPPRAAQEIHLHLRRAAEELGHELHRSPTVAELAERLDVDEEQVLSGLVVGTTRESESIHRQIRDDEGALTLEATLGDVDPGIDLTEVRMIVRRGTDKLDHRQIELLHQRFIDGLSQPEIAARHGISQSYVSRIIRSALATLREEFDEDGSIPVQA